MRWLIAAVAVALPLVAQTFASERPTLARVTVYWKYNVTGANAAWNDVKLREGHCAVDPKKIPYGSKVVFHDAECVAVDTGPAVVNRKAVRVCGRSVAERNAIVIDRFFHAKQDALAWAEANPYFMIVKIRTAVTDATLLTLIGDRKFQYRYGTA